MEIMKPAIMWRINLNSTPMKLLQLQVQIIQLMVLGQLPTVAAE